MPFCLFFGKRNFCFSDTIPRIGGVILPVVRESTVCASLRGRRILCSLDCGSRNCL